MNWHTTITHIGVNGDGSDGKRYGLMLTLFLMLPATRQPRLRNGLAVWLYRMVSARESITTWLRFRLTLYGRRLLLA